MEKFLFVGLGGAIGAVLRYLLSGFVYKHSPTIFPLSTLFVNVLGCFGAGFLWEIFERGVFSLELRVFVFAGILGGFTTFSAFSLENLNLFRDGEAGLAILNILSSNVLCLGFVYCGFAAARYLVPLVK